MMLSLSQNVFLHIRIINQIVKITQFYLLSKTALNTNNIFDATYLDAGGMDHRVLFLYVDVQVNGKVVSGASAPIAPGYLPVVVSPAVPDLRQPLPAVLAEG